jgi:hypothetical protein
MNTASLSRISTTINGDAEIIPSGSEQETWYRAQHLANNTFGPTDEDLYSSSPVGGGLWGGGGLATSNTREDETREGDGGTKCYVEGDAVRVVVVKVRDGRIADWKGQVRDWTLEERDTTCTPTINGSTV